MPRLPRKNPASAVDNPLAPPVNLGEHQEGQRHGKAPILYLGRLPADPTYLPDDGVCRIWYVSGALKANFEGTTYTLASSNLRTEAGDPAADQSQVLIAVNNGAVVLRRVEIGAADSAGAGYRTLRVLN